MSVADVITPTDNIISTGNRIGMYASATMMAFAVISIMFSIVATSKNVQKFINESEYAGGVIFIFIGATVLIGFRFAYIVFPIDNILGTCITIFAIYPIIFLFMFLFHFGKNYKINKKTNKKQKSFNKKHNKQNIKKNT